MINRRSARRRLPFAALALSAAAMLSLSACTGTSEPDANGGGSISWAIDVVPETLNPQINGQTRARPIFRNVYETLLVQNDAGEFVGALASDYEISEDGTVYTFTIRDGVTFSNGEALDAAAVALNFEKINDPTYDEEAAGSGPLARLVSVEAVDEQTVVLTLDRAYAPFLDYAAAVFIIAPASYDVPDVQAGGAEVYGTGPFVIDSVIEGQEVTLVKREDYDWAPETAAHTGPAHLDEVTFHYLTESSVRLGALTSGQVDVITGVNAGDVGAIEGDDGLVYTSASNAGAPWSLYLNSTAGPGQDPRVREAFVLSADIDSIVDSVYQGKRTRAWSAISVASGSGYNEALEGAYGPDFDRAAELLDDAGWTGRDAEGFRVNTAGERLTFTLYRTGAFTADDRDVFLQALQAQLRQNSGIELDIQSVDGGVWYEHFLAGDAGASDLVTGGSTGLILEYVWAPKAEGGVINLSNAEDPQLAEWIGEASGSSDLAVQDAAYRALQAFVVLEGHYILPLVEAQQELAYRVGVEGLGFLPVSGDPGWAYDAWLEN